MRCFHLLTRFSVLMFLLILSFQAVAQSSDDMTDASSSSVYGGSIFDRESMGVSAGFHRWLGRVGTHYVDSIGAVMLVGVDDPWANNQLFFGAAFATAVGQYGDPDAKNIFAAAASTTDYIDQGRSYGGTAALPPLDYSYSTLAARAAYRLRTNSFISAGTYADLGFGLLGTQDDAQANGFVAIGANVVVKIFPTVIMTVGIQYRQDIPVNDRIAGFEDMSALAIYNSFELVKF